MILRINQIKLRPDHSRKDLETEIQKILRINQKITSYEIMRRSIDARKKPDIYYVYTVDVTLSCGEKFWKNLKKNKKITRIEKTEFTFPVIVGSEQQKNAPVVVGSGPAGLFSALMLARCGLHPIVLERGESVEKRVKTVEEFWKTGKLNPSSNVQFGEGGAGTFSDGKLNTLIKDPNGRIRFVLKEFIRAGADPEIIYHQKPHIGTDVLIHVVRAIREEILSLGGTFLFENCLTGLRKSNDPDKGRYVLEINDGEKEMYCDELILALGHSARDTFAMLYEKNIPMQAKSFAVGLRIEHSQRMIDEAMYGIACPYEMEAAPYKVTHKCENGRGVYSFCMCPGGYVVNASSEEGMTAVNGMSYSGRDSENANSAIIVTVNPQDYIQDDSPLSGIEFQRRLEKEAWRCGEGKIPVQRYEDYCLNQKTKKNGKLPIIVKGQYQLANLRTILPEELNQSIIEGIQAFGRMIQGFDDPDALLLGVESRTSSPVRIIRDENCQSAWSGIYPCGEGAGYAGGIVSAAVDGIRVAEALVNRRMEQKN